MLPKALSELITDFSALPGVGPKSATRLALSLLKTQDSRLIEFSKHLAVLKDKIHYCPDCYNFSEKDICDICQNPHRVKNKILVVEDPLEIDTFEEIGFDGMYHVLGGLISPLQDIGPDNIKLKELQERLIEISKKNKINDFEVISALATSLEGEATSNYLKDQILKVSDGMFKVKFTMLARGIPANTLIEYQDRTTLKASLEHRE